MWGHLPKSLQHIKTLRHSSKSPWSSFFSCSYSDAPYKRSKLAPLQERRMVDSFRLYVKGGGGGSGCSSTHRSRHDRRGRPDGGNGGRGGDMILECSPTRWDFSGLQPRLLAQRGGHGSSKNKIGTRGADKVGQVPIDTMIHLLKGGTPCVAERLIPKDLDQWEIPGTPIGDVTGSDQHPMLTGLNTAEDSDSSSSQPDRTVEESAGKIGIPPWEQLWDLVLELEYHLEGLSNRPSLIVENEIDEDGGEEVYEELERRVQDVSIFPVCAVLEDRVPEVKLTLKKLVNGEISDILVLDKITVD